MKRSPVVALLTGLAADVIGDILAPTRSRKPAPLPGTLERAEAKRAARAAKRLKLRATGAIAAAPPPKNTPLSRAEARHALTGVRLRGDARTRVRLAAGIDLIEDAVLALTPFLSPPFAIDPEGLFVYDTADDPRMVASVEFEAGTVIPRGHGWAVYLDGTSAILDAIATLVRAARSVGDVDVPAAAVADALNDFWRTHV